MQDPVAQRWERYWSQRPADERDASWLAPYLPRLRECGPVLELGSGAGVDSEVLSQLGALMALDYSRAALLQLRRRVQAAGCVLADLRSPLPFRSGAFGAVIASLCLHYFDSTTTHAILADIRRCTRASSGGR